jgi:predicted Zn-dependent peptidase
MTRPVAHILVTLLMASACGPCPQGPVTRQLKLAFTSEASTPPFTLDYLDTTLETGLGTILTPVPQGIPVTLSLWIRAGSDDEQEGEAGAAHLARRVLLDAGTDPVAAAAADGVIAAGGRVEAWTSRRATVITVTAPEGALDEAVTVLGPFVRPPGIQDTSLARARQEVENEADAFWSAPLARARDRLFSLVLGPGQPAALYPCLADLDKTGRDPVSAFIHRTYTSGRMILGASMSRDSLDVLDGLPAPRKGGGKKGPAPPDPPDVPAAVLDPAGVAGDALVVGGVLLPGLSAKKGAASHLLARRLAARGPGTVHEHLTRPGGGFTDVDTVIEATDSGNLVTFSGHVAPGGEHEAVGSLAAALAEQGAIPPAGPALEHAALQTAAVWMTDLQDPFVAPSRFARHAFLTHGSLSPEDHLALLFEVEPPEAGALAQMLLRAGSARFVLVPSPTGGHDEPPLPGAGELAAAAAEAVARVSEAADRAGEQCGAREGLAASAGPGARVVALRTAASGGVAITALLGAGSLNDPPGREGSAALLSLLLARSLDEAVKGSPGLDPGFVTSSTTHDAQAVGVHLVVPPDRWLEGVLAVRSAILSPALDATSFEHARQQLLSLGGPEPDGQGAARRDAIASLLGLGSGHDPGGTVASLGTLSVQEMERFHHAALARDVVLAIAGEVDVEHACTAASVALRPSVVEPGGETLALVSPSPTAAPVALEAGSGAVAWVTLAWPMPGRAHEDHAASLVLARLLGGEHGALTASVIQEGGLAESIDVQSWAGRDWGVLLVHVRTPSANVQAVIGRVEGTMSSLAETPPSNDALAAAVGAVLLARAEQLALPATAARLVAAEALAGLDAPPEDLEDALGAVGRNTIAELVASHLVGVTPAVAVHAP